MSTPTLAAIGVFFVALLLYQAHVTSRVVKSNSLTRAQKALQTVFVWVVPFVGAATVHAFLASDTEIPLPRDKDFVPHYGNDPEV